MQLLVSAGMRRCLQEYANVLMEAIPYYPYQIDIQRAGVIAFLNIFERKFCLVESVDTSPEFAADACPACRICGRVLQDSAGSVRAGFYRFCMRTSAAITIRCRGAPLACFR